jgi:tetrahydromethanopterin S-methyltransferase subunit G
MSKTLETRLDELKDLVHSIDKTLSRNTDALEMHMHRTDQLEKKLEPVEAHVARVNGAFILLSVVSILTGVVASLYKVFAS